MLMQNGMLNYQKSKYILNMNKRFDIINMKMLDFGAIWNVKYPGWGHIRYSQYSTTSSLYQLVHINSTGHVKTTLIIMVIIIFILIIIIPTIIIIIVIIITIIIIINILPPRGSSLCWISTAVDMARCDGL